MTRRVCILGELAAMAERRKTASPDDSYTARLLQGDEDSLLKKLAEEAGEAALAAKGGNREKLAAEIADLAYHAVVVLARYNVSLEQVAAALRARRGGSGLSEKSARERK